MQDLGRIGSGKLGRGGPEFKFGAYEEMMCTLWHRKFAQKEAGKFASPGT